MVTRKIKFGVKESFNFEVFCERMWAMGWKLYTNVAIRVVVF